MALTRLDTDMLKDVIAKGVNYSNSITGLLALQKWSHAALFLAALPSDHLQVVLGNKQLKYLLASHRDLLLKGFIALKDNINNYATLAREVVDSENVLGCIFHKPSNPVTHTLFFSKKMGDQKVTAEIKAISDSIPPTLRL